MPRLIPSLESSIRNLQAIREALIEIRELIEGYVDIDKNGGPNNAMRAQNIIDEVLR